MKDITKLGITFLVVFIATGVWALSAYDIDPMKPIQPIASEALFDLQLESPVGVDDGEAGIETGIYYDVGSPLSTYTSAGGIAIHNVLVQGLYAIFGTSQNINIWGVELIPSGPAADNDVGIQSIVAPVTGPDLTATEAVTVNIKNYGTNTQTEFDVFFTLDGGTAVVETISATINGGETFEHTFATTVDLSAYNVYEFEACTDLTGDEEPGNDCVTNTVENFATGYCDATTNSEDEYIANVLCGDINNTSGWQGGVADYTDLTTNITTGEMEDIVIANGSAWASDVVYVWVDWNMNYEFDQGTDEEFILENVGGTGESFTGVIAVPLGTAEGEYRMRVRMTYGTAPLPCDTANFGEVEDYTITVEAENYTVAFFDDFESGIANWEVEGAWEITDEQSFSPSNSLADSPGGNYLANQNISATMVTGVDLSDPALLSASVNWWMIMDIENGNFDYLYLEVSTDDFATSVEIASFFGEDMLDPWVEYSYSLGAFLGNDNVKVRFRFYSDGGYEVDGCYIDDFVILTSDVDEAPPQVFFDAPVAYEGSLEEYVVEAEIIDASSVASAEVVYAVDGVTQTNIVGVNISGDTWEFTIPQQDPGYQVDFIITAIDASPAANEVITDTASYIAGNYIGYDNLEVDFYTEIGPGGSQPTATGTAVVFTLENPTQLVTALIRNYTDQSVIPPNNETMEVHVWSDGGTGPGDDLIDPIDITIEADLVNTRAFTRVDLRPYAAQLSDILGNVFVGYVVPDGVVRTTITQPGIANRSFLLNNGTWGSIPDDYHFRIITGEAGVNPYPAPENVTAIVENLNDVNLDWDVPGSGDPLGYNIFRNDDNIGYVAAPTTEYDDTGVEVGTYTYCVTAVYEGGESLPACADPVTINPTEPPPAPTNLITTVVAEDIVLTWDAPGDEWIQWDDGVNAVNGVGITGGGTFSVASHWDPVSLVNYNGLTLTQIQFFPFGDPAAEYTFKVWIGADGSNEVLSQDITTFAVDEWNVIDLTFSIPIDGTQDLWFGYEVTHGTGTNPAGCDAGPAIAGYGDMIYMNNAWSSLSSTSAINVNWNLAGYVEAMDGTTKLLGQEIKPTSTNGTLVASGSTGTPKKMKTGGSKSLDEYNIYYSFDGGAFSLAATTTETTFTHEDVGIIVGEHCYEVTAVYDPQGESDPTDESCELITSVPEFLLNATVIYPNPASEVVNIKSDYDITSIKVFNHSGQIVAEEMVHNKMYQFNTSQYNAGLYFFQIETSEGRVSKRIIVQ